MSAVTQSERILAFLRAHPGASILEISYGLHPFVANPRARISDLRAQGYDIACERDRDGVQRYRVVERSVQLVVGL